MEQTPCEDAVTTIHIINMFKSLLYSNIYTRNHILLNNTSYNVNKMKCCNINTYIIYIINKIIKILSKVEPNILKEIIIYTIYTISCLTLFTIMVLSTINKHFGKTIFS